MGHEAYATGVPSYVNISDPFTWHHQNEAIRQYFLCKELSHNR